MTGSPDQPSMAAYPPVVVAPVLHLFTAGLFSKWGFGDGDMPDDFLDWCDEQGIDYSGFRWKPTLTRLVRERLVPALDAEVETVEISTSHNPIRASKVNGEDVEDRWYDDWSDYGIKPEVVVVPFADVLAVAREVADG